MISFAAYHLIGCCLAATLGTSHAWHTRARAEPHWDSTTFRLNPSLDEPNIRPHRTVRTVKDSLNSLYRSGVWSVWDVKRSLLEKTWCMMDWNQSTVLEPVLPTQFFQRHAHYNQCLVCFADTHRSKTITSPSFPSLQGIQLETPIRHGCNQDQSSSFSYPRLCWIHIQPRKWRVWPKTPLCRWALGWQMQSTKPLIRADVGACRWVAGMPQSLDTR